MGLVFVQLLEKFIEVDSEADLRQLADVAGQLANAALVRLKEFAFGWFDDPTTNSPLTYSLSGL